MKDELDRTIKCMEEMKDAVASAHEVKSKLEALEKAHAALTGNI